MGDKPKVANMDVPSSFQQQERRFAESVKENVDILTGQRGDSLDRAITFRDLLDAGVIQFKSGFGPDGTDPTVEPTPPYLDVDIPPAPENLTATAAFRIIVLSWTMVKYRGHDYFELFRNASDDISTANIHTTLPGYANFYGDDVGTSDGIGQTFYYWVRAVNKNGVEGPFNAVAGTEGTTQTDVDVLIDTIEGEILESSLNTQLQATINKIDPTEAVVTNMKDLYSVKLQSSTSDMTGQTVPTTGNLTATLGTSTIVCNHTSSGNTLRVGDIVTISGATGLGGAITAAMLNGKHIIKATTSLAFRFTVEEGTVDFDASVEAVTSTAADTGNGGGSVVLSFQLPYVAGFGLSYYEDANGDPTSAFIVNAEKFAIVAPSFASRVADDDVTKMPFYVTTTATTDATTGIPIPAGVYVRDLFVGKAAIVNLIAGNVAADAIRAGMIASATSILTPSINMGSLNAPDANRPWDWTIDNSSTRYTNFSVSVGGEMHANYGRLRGMDIRAADDTVLLRAGGAILGTGGSLINNGDFSGETNSAGAVEYGNGWTSSGTATFATGQVTLTQGSYIDSEHFPLTAGETLYVEVYGSGITSSSLAITIIGYNESKAYLASNTSVAGGGWDVASNIAVGALQAGTDSSIAYGKIRLSSSSGTNVFYNLYVGKSPRKLAPQYASTYIRNATVDTLQIAGNAATVPLSNDWPAGSYQTHAVETVVTTSTLGADFGTSVPSKVVCLATIKVGSSGFGGDWASGVITLRYNTSNSTAISGSTIVQQVGQHGKKGAPPTLLIHKTITGWSSPRYFFLTLTVTGDPYNATGWWKAEATNLTLLGSRR